MTVRTPGTGRITRRQFIRKAGVGAAVAGAAAVGLSGTARAHLPPDESVLIRNADWDGTNWTDAGPATPGYGAYLLLPFGTSDGWANAFPAETYQWYTTDWITTYALNGPTLAALPAFDALNSASRNVVADNSPNLPPYPVVAGALDAQQTARLNQVVVAWRASCTALDVAYYRQHDFQHVQWAVDNVALGGTVFLKAPLDENGDVIPFDFGFSNQIRIRRDLTFRGEVLSRNTPSAPGKPGGWVDKGATIKGGHRTLWGERPSYIPSVAIKDIIFFKTFNQPIHINTAKGYNEISGCRFKNVMLGYTGVTSGVYGAFNLLIHGGANAAAINALGGKFRISNNFFGKTYMPDGVTEAENINNVMHYTNCNADFDILENEIEDCTWVGFTIANNKGFTRISRNKITKTRSYGVIGFAIGIGAVPSNALFVTNEAYDGSAEITDNDIVLGSPTAPWSTTNSHGIIIMRFPTTQQFPGFPNLPPHIAEPPDIHYLVSGNRITIYRNNSITDPSKSQLNPSAVTIIGSSRNVTVVNNTIKGEASYGFTLARYVASPMAAPNGDAFVTDNLFSGNDFRGFSAGTTDIFLDEFTMRNHFGTDKRAGRNMFGPLTQSGLGVILDYGNGNEFVKNDYKSTGVPGWSFDSSMNLLTPGCVLLAGQNNFVFESGGFPVIGGVETDAKTQVFDALLLPGSPTYPKTNNRVVGHPADTYQSDAYKTPGLGQALQNMKEVYSCQLSGGVWDPVSQTCLAPQGTQALKSVLEQDRWE